MTTVSNLKIAIASLTILGASITAAGAAEITKTDAKEEVTAILLNHEHQQYHRLKTSTIRKVGNNWNVSVKTLNGVKVATGIVNATTGKVTFKN